MKQTTLSFGGNASIVSAVPPKKVLAKKKATTKRLDLQLYQNNLVRASHRVAPPASRDTHPNQVSHELRMVLPDVLISRLNLRALKTQ